MRTIKQYLEEKPTLQRVVVGYPVLNNKVLLGLRKKVSFGLGKNLMSGIGGKCEMNETDDAALIREFSEEVRIEPVSFKKTGEVIFLFPHKPKWNQLCEIYLINEWTGEPKETEVMKPIWFNKNELPEDQMWEDNLYWIRLVLKNKKVKGTFLYSQESKVIEHILDVET